MTQIIGTNTFCEAKWVVSPTASDGTHTTVQGAINSAVAGDTIFLRPGTYTENLTLKDGITISTFRGAGRAGNVIVIGNVTFTAAGTASLSNFRLQTNAASCVTVSGSAASILNLLNIDFLVNNATGITFSSSNIRAQINLFNCSGDIAGAFAFLAHSSAGIFDQRYTEITNSGGSTVASTASAGVFNCRWSRKSTPLTTSGTNSAVIGYSIFDTSAQNVTGLTAGGTSLVSKFNIFASGTASAISIGGAMTSFQDSVNSSNANAVTGAGTLTYSGMVFPGSSSTVNTTTKTGVGQASANGAAGTVLQAAGAGAIPAYSTATYPATTTINQVLYSSATNVVGGITAANNGTMISSASGVPSWLANGTTGQILTATTGAPPSWAAASGSGINKVLGQLFTSTGAFTYTPSTGMLYVIVELIGAGGGSGGVAGTAGLGVSSGGAGGGAYAKFILTAAQVGASLSGSVGTGGTAGSAGANNGGNGGSTTLATTAAWTAGGGALSAGQTASLVASAGGAGGTVTTGTGTLLANIPGEHGEVGLVIALGSTGGASGRGGNSHLGFGGFSVIANGTGNTGTGYGGGASGSMENNATANAAGAAGGNGAAIFTEFTT